MKKPLVMTRKFAILESPPDEIHLRNETLNETRIIGGVGFQKFCDSLNARVREYWPNYHASPEDRIAAFVEAIDDTCEMFWKGC